MPSSPFAGEMPLALLNPSRPVGGEQSLQVLDLPLCAAPQIGVGLRVLVIEVPEDEEAHGGEQVILINPEITKAEGEQFGEEGCLSIPGYVGMVRRANQVSVKGLNRKGKEVRVKGTGLLARALQHEIDHLDGILFTYRLEKREDLYRIGDENERIPVFQRGAGRPIKKKEAILT